MTAGTGKVPHTPGERRRPLARVAAFGVVCALGQNFGYRAIGFLAQLLLARVLLPADFGQLGLALTVNATVMALTDFGLEDVLVSRHKAVRLWARPAFGVSVALSLAGALLMLAAAPAAAWLYRTPNLEGMVDLLALHAVLYGLAMVPAARLRSDMRFGFTSAYTLGEFVVAQTLTFALALRGFGAFAFVIPSPVMAAIRLIVFHRMAPVQLRGAFRIRRWRCLLARSGLVFGQRVFLNLREQGDYVLLGLVSSPEVVGAYFLGFRLAAQPVYALVRSLSVVLFPAMASLARDPQRQTGVAVRAAVILAYVVTPFSFLQAALAEPAIRLLFSPQWHAAIPFVQILSVALAFEVLPCVGGALASARGRFRFQFRAAIASAALFLLAISLGFMAGGAIGLAVGVAVFFAGMSAVYGYLAFAPMPNALSTVAGLWAQPVVLSANAIGLAHLLDATLIDPDRLWVRIGFTAVAGTAGYGIVLWIFARTAARDLLSEGSNLKRIFLRAKPA